MGKVSTQHTLRPARSRSQIWARWFSNIRELNKIWECLGEHELFKSCNTSPPISQSIILDPFQQCNVEAWSEFAILQWDDMGILFSEAQSRKVTATSIAFSKFRVFAKMNLPHVHIQDGSSVSFSMCSPLQTNIQLNADRIFNHFLHSLIQLNSDKTRNHPIPHSWLWETNHTLEM